MDQANGELARLEQGNLELTDPRCDLDETEEDDSMLLHSAKRTCVCGAGGLASSVAAAAFAVPSTSSTLSSISVQQRRDVGNARKRQNPLQTRLVELQTERLRLELDQLQSERMHLEAIEAHLDKEGDCERALADIHDEDDVNVSEGAADTTESKSVSSASKKRGLILNFDGASKNNPGEAGAGWILADATTGESVAYGWKYLGERNTNNEAEYTGLIEGLAYIKNCVEDAGPIDVKGDSNLVIQQVLGNWKCKATNLMPYCERAKAIYKSLGKQGNVTLMHVPREDNAVADTISNLAVRMRSTKLCENVNVKVDVEFLRKKFGSA